MSDRPRTRLRYIKKLLEEAVEELESAIEVEEKEQTKIADIFAESYRGTSERKQSMNQKLPEGCKRPSVWRCEDGHYFAYYFSRWRWYADETGVTVEVEVHDDGTIILRNDVDGLMTRSSERMLPSALLCQTKQPVGDRIARR